MPDSFLQITLWGPDLQGGTPMIYASQTTIPLYSFVLSYAVLKHLLLGF